jgi:hypothetical protein
LVVVRHSPYLRRAVVKEAACSTETLVYSDDYTASDPRHQNTNTRHYENLELYTYPLLNSMIC